MKPLGLLDTRTKPITSGFVCDFVVKDWRMTGMRDEVGSDHHE
jgi:hypothetical protein